MAIATKRARPILQEDDEPTPPVECCLYPCAATDLPEQVDLFVDGSLDVTYYLYLGPVPGYEYAEGHVYVKNPFSPTPGDNGVIFPSGFSADDEWFIENTGLFNSCLIGVYSEDTAIKDQFPDTYMVDLGGGDTGTVTRIPETNLCQWLGISSGSVTILLEYVSATYQFKVNGVAKDSDNSAPDAGTGDYGAFNVS